METLFFAIKAIYIGLSIQERNEEKVHDRVRDILSRTISVAVVFLWGVYFPADTLRLYFLKNIFEIAAMSFYLQYRRKGNGNIYITAEACLLELTYEIIYLISAIGGNAVYWILGITLDLYQEESLIIFSAIIITIVLAVEDRVKNKWRPIALSTNQYRLLIIFSCVIFYSIKATFIFTDISYAQVYKGAIIAMIVSLAAFVVISGNEKYKTAEEKVKIEEDNRRLSAQLHKSKEVLPVMLSVLKEMIDEDTGEENQQAYRLLREVHDLYGQQLIENHKEDLVLKSFGSTGLQILDQQLEKYLKEAQEKKINMDIFIPEPIDKLLREEKINRLKFQRTVGDMIRNAFFAVEKADDGEGEIFVIIGCGDESFLEIVVLDNGVYFPKAVLKNFGQRGITTGGTGNGLADIVEFVKEEKASLILEEYESGEEMFSKRFTVLFDGKEQLILPRK